MVQFLGRVVAVFVMTTSCVCIIKYKFHGNQEKPTFENQHTYENQRLTKNNFAESRKLQFLNLQNKFRNDFQTENWITNLNVSEEYRKVISDQWIKIKQDLKDFPFKEKIKGIDERSDSTLPDHPRPIQNLIVTSWRSGSTFMGELVNNHSGTFYHCEPLEHLDEVIVRHGKLEEYALTIIKDMFKCKYEGNEEYLQSHSTHSYSYKSNVRLWNACQSINQSVCFDYKFIQPFCQLFPFHIMKTVRLRMNLIGPLLEDKSFNLKVVLLVRDPRGMYESRMQRFWCPGKSDCDDPFHFCTDMISDYYAAKKLTTKYPDRIKVIRYEDFSMDVYNESKSLLNFFDLEYNKSTEVFLKEHTKFNDGDVDSTFRNSKTNPLNWRKKLSFEKVIEIQNACEETMKLFGYNIVHSSYNEELMKFNPVGKFNF